MAGRIDLNTTGRIAGFIVLLLAIVVGAKFSGDWVMDQLTPYLTPSTEPALHRMIMTAMVVYIVLMMLPFVPGVEIGLGMMVTFGPDIAPLVYGSTVLALSLSFLLGRLVPQATIIGVLATMRLKRAAALLRDLQPLSTDERLDFILQSRSNRVVRSLLRYRYLALMAALNIPGNAVMGGGGGICMTAGYCRLFPLSGFLIAVALAVAPVPLMIFLTG